VKLEAGILIIRSLYWNNDGGRKDWREDRLLNDRAKIVRVPMRYGRLSNKCSGVPKSGTYTMVFADLPPRRFGQAKVVPCRNAVANITDLTTEAEWLWAAEEKKVTCRKDEEHRQVGTSHAISATWGYVALLVNPASAKDPKKGLAVEDLRKPWAQHFSQQAYGKKPKSLKSCLVDKHGLLKIGWPQIVDGGEPLGLDLLLATSNCPERRPPTIKAIVSAWWRDGGEHVDYFWKNYHNGFHTFQDEKIKEHLQKLGHPVCDRPAFRPK
jgi:hypothetical protein